LCSSAILRIQRSGLTDIHSSSHVFKENVFLKGKSLCERTLLDNLRHTQ